MEERAYSGPVTSEAAAALFPYAEDEGLSASPATIDDLAAHMDATGGQVEQVNTDVGTAHRTALNATSGELYTLAAQAPGETGKRASQVLAATLCAAGATRLFADRGVRAYNAHVDDLRTEYDERKLEIMSSDCGVAEVDCPKDASDSEQAKLDQERSDEVDAARTGEIAALEHELRKRQEEYRGDPLDAEADAAVSLLEKGPSDEVLKELFAAGVLPSQTVDAFPGVHFTYDELPSDFQKRSKEEIEEYLRDHPEASKLVDDLLTKKGELSDTELTVVEVQAEIDADLLKDGLDKEAGSDALDAIGAATERLELINQHLAEGGKWTDAAEIYAHTWIDDVGAKNLTKLADHVSSSWEVTTHGGVPDDSAMETYLSPVSDVILNLSNEENYPSDACRVMPEAIQELVDIRVGEAQDGYRAGDITHDGLMRLDQVKNLGKFVGWCDLMATSTVEGGDQFSEDLADQAITAKQDMNAIWAWASKMSEAHTLTDEELSYLQENLSDSGSSDLLSVVSRNEDASANLLIDEERRQQLLGMNWDDGEGAADVIRGGTDRDPEDGGGSKLQAKAALKVMTEIASDPKEYADRADNEKVSDAILDVGITWIDTFGENVNGDTKSKYNVDDTDVLGRELPLSVTLSEADQESFLEFVASRGDTDAIRFETASQYYGQQLVADALDQSDPDVLDDALEWAGRADGQIRQANLEWAFDDLGDKQTQEKAELLAQNRTMAAANATAKVLLGVGSTAGGAAFPPSAPFLSVGNTLAGPIIDEVLDQEPIPDYESMEDEEVNKQLESDALNSTSRRNMLLAQVAQMKGETGDSHLYNDDGSLKTPEEIANLTSPVNGLDELEALAESVVRDWNSKQEAHDQVDIDQFDAARDDTFTSARADDDQKSKDGWRDGEDIRRNLYGDNLPSWYGDSEDDEYDEEIEDNYEANDDKIGKVGVR